MKLLIICIACAVLVAGEVTRYDNFQVWRVTPTNAADLQALKLLQENNQVYDFWCDVGKINGSVDIMVAPHLRNQFLDAFNSSHSDSHLELFIEDVQKLIDREQPPTKDVKLKVNFKQYNTYDEINAWLSELADEYEEVTLVEGGESYEGRKIFGVHISFNKTNENRAVFLEGGIHAREWIAVSTVMFQANEILTSTDPAVRAMAESHDWYIFPVTNPDGYAYTFEKNRLWRKTRQPYGMCVGADPNRNWGYKWNEGGASNNPCFDTYAGSKAFSEPETKSLSEYIDIIASKLVAYIGHHSYSQYLLVPYGDSNQHTADNHKELMEIGGRAVKSLAQRYGTQFQVGNIVDLVYVATGSSMDWVKATYGVPLTYTYELRDKGRYGFILPADQIIPSGQEVVDALVTILA